MRYLSGPVRYEPMKSNIQILDVDSDWCGAWKAGPRWPESPPPLRLVPPSVFLPRLWSRVAKQHECCTMFLSLFVSRPLKILRNLQGKMGHAWSRGLTGISALLPNLPHIRGIYGQLVDFGHCSSSFWPQGPALNRFLCNFVPRPKDCNRDRCQGRLAPVVKIR